MGVLPWQGALVGAAPTNPNYGLRTLAPGGADAGELLWGLRLLAAACAPGTGLTARGSSASGSVRHGPGSPCSAPGSGSKALILHRQ